MHSIVRTGSLAILTAAIAACTASADNIISKMDQVSIGSTRAAVVADMGGPPTATTTSSIFGLETATLAWRAGATTCEVTLVHDRTVAKFCRSPSS